jgi:UrcA family protein
MTKHRFAMIGTALTALLCIGGVAKAQDYYDRYDRVYDNGTETVIVHPYYYDEIQKRQVIGRVNGEVNPTEYTLSRPVSFSDLDLTRDDDYLELKARIRATAENLCAELDDRVPQLRGDSSADRECVRTATRHAMQDVFDREATLIARR